MTIHRKKAEICSAEVNGKNSLFVSKNFDMEEINGLYEH